MGDDNEMNQSTRESQINYRNELKDSENQNQVLHISPLYKAVHEASHLLIKAKNDERLFLQTTFS